jgi:hypothetical protein
LAAFLKASRTSLGLVLAFFAIASEKITSAGRNIEAQCFRGNLKQVGTADCTEYREAAGAVALKRYNLRQTAAVPIGSTVEHCEGILFGARSPLKHVVWNIGGKNFLVSFNFAYLLFVHGIARPANGEPLMRWRLSLPI